MNYLTKHKFFLVVAMIFIIFGVLGKFLSGQYGWYVWLHFILAGLFFVAALFTSFFREHKQEFAARSNFKLAGVLKLVVLLVLLALANYLIANLSWRADFTEQKTRSLESVTYDLIKQISTTTEFYILKLSSNEQTYKNQSLIKLYQEAAQNFVVIHVVDPLLQPGLVKLLGLRPGDQLAIRRADNGLTARLTKIDEQNVNIAINKITRTNRDQILYLTGHNEPDINSSEPEGLFAFKQNLANEAIDLVPFNITENIELVKSARAIMIVEPKVNLTDQELGFLQNYLQTGGALAVLEEPDSDSNLNKLLSNYGITVLPEVVLDFSSSNGNSEEASWQLQLTNFGKHELTSKLNKQTPLSLLYVAPLQLSQKLQDAGVLTSLFNTSQQAWGEKDISSLNTASPTASYEPGLDSAGPLTVAAAYLSENKQYQPGRLVVVGDSTWIKNYNYNFNSNSLFALQLVKWVAKLSLSNTINTKGVKKHPAFINANAFRTMILWSCFVPELILLFGIVIWWRRNSATMSGQLSA